MFYLKTLHTIPHTDKVKKVCLKLLQIKNKTFTSVGYSQRLLNTLLKHLWQQLQPPLWVWCYKLGNYFWAVFPHCSLQNLSGSIRLDEERRYTAIFRSLQRCSIRFNSGLWLSHSRTFTELSWSHCFVILAVCFGSLSCWKMNLRTGQRSRALWSRLSSRMSL